MTGKAYIAGVIGPDLPFEVMPEDMRTNFDRFLRYGECFVPVDGDTDPSMIDFVNLYYGGNGMFCGSLDDPRVDEIKRIIDGQDFYDSF